MIGQTISHYRITEKLGGGGMGVVYKAIDTKLDRPVALKFLPPELTRDPDAKRRFIHEAKAASALQHNNICTIHEIDETQDGHVFITMDCYEGESLKQKIARGPLPVVEALEIACQVAEGLTKAHDAGMVHRDIKPANIMITNDGVVKIVDFGLAKLAGQTKITKTGTTVGTVAYMSPEQATGKDIDQRSDVFSLGSVLYEVLTGEVPFKGDHEAAVLYGIVHSEPDELSRLRRGLPEQLQSILDKAMAKDPKDRYSDASKLMTDLFPLRPARGSAVGASHESRGRLKPTRITAFIVAIAAIVAIAVIAVFVARHLVSTPSVDDLSLAVVDFSNIADADDHITAAGITGLIHVGLVESSPIRVVSPSYLQDLRRRLFGAARGPIEEGQAMEVAKKSGAAFLLTGQIVRLGKDQYVTWRLMDVKTGGSLAAKRVDEVRPAELADKIVAGVLPILAAKAGIAEPVPSKPVNTMTTGSQEAYRHFVAGILAMDEAREDDAVRQFEQAVRIDSTFALAYFELSRTHTRESGPGRLYAETAWALRSRLGEKDRRRLEAWMAWVDYRVKDALEIERGLLTRWPDDRVILDGLKEKLFHNWYAEEAAKVAEEGLRLYPDDYGFGQVYWMELAGIGREKEALDAVRLQTRRHPQNPDAWDCLGVMYQQMGSPDSATASFDKALAIDPDFVWSHRSLAHQAYYDGDAKRAIELLERVLERADLLPRQRLSILTDYLQFPSIAFFYAEQGRFVNSFDVIERAKQYAPDFEGELRHIIASRNRLWLKTGHADKVLASAASLTARDASRVAALKALEYRTAALVALDSLDAARAGVDELRNAEDYWGGYSQTIANKMTAKIALREGDYHTALSALEGMKPYGIPFGFMFDIDYRELRARAYVLAGRLEDAAVVHSELLRLYGGHALSHYELGKIYEEMKRPADARAEFTRFIDLWSDADEGLPQVEDAQSRLSALRQEI